MLLAGMPAPMWNEVAALRVEAISFFLLVFFLIPFPVQWLWNGMARDFTSLPKLGYLTSLGMVTVWGLVFVVVLTMISGRGELMTPGAWKPQGWTYKLNAPEEPKTTPNSTPTDDGKLREQKLALLRASLWQYAETHDGQFPPNRETTGITAEVWVTPDLSGLRYVYHAGRTPDQKSERPLAYEPGTVGDERFVLFTSGAIRKLTHAELHHALQE